jgi:hypothetical protein
LFFYVRQMVSRRKGTGQADCKKCIYLFSCWYGSRPQPNSGCMSRSLRSVCNLSLTFPQTLRYISRQRDGTASGGLTNIPDPKKKIDGGQIMIQLEVLQNPPNRRASSADRRHAHDRRLCTDRRQRGEHRQRTNSPALTAEDAQTLNELLSEAHARIRKLEGAIDTLTKAL